MKHQKDNSHLCHGDDIYCPMKQSQIGILIFLNKEDKDTIIGYNCEYPNCYPNLCKLPTKYPIGGSDREAKAKKNHGSSNDA